MIRYQSNINFRKFLISDLLIFFFGFICVQTIYCSSLDTIVWYGGFEVPEYINANAIKPEKPQNIEFYKGIYSFGYSEMESSIIVVIDSNQMYLQRRSGKFSENGNTWIWEYQNARNIKLVGNKFAAQGWKGEFVTYTYCPKEIDDNMNIKSFPKKSIHGLILCMSVADTYFEFGEKSENTLDEYPITFTRSIKELDLKGKTKIELKIMRNEIYARYGFIFQPNGEMDIYFRKQQWYTPQTKLVDNFLTELEKKNIKFLITYESIK